MEPRYLEEGSDDQDTKAAGTDQSNQHRKDGVSDSAQRPYGCIHKAAYCVSDSNNQKPVHSGRNDIGTLGVNPQQLRAKQCCEDPQECSQN